MVKLTPLVQTTWTATGGNDLFNEPENLNVGTFQLCDNAWRCRNPYRWDLGKDEELRKECPCV